MHLREENNSFSVQRRGIIISGFYLKVITFQET